MRSYLDLISPYNIIIIGLLHYHTREIITGRSALSHRAFASICIDFGGFCPVGRHVTPKFELCLESFDIGLQMVDPKTVNCMKFGNIDLNVPFEDVSYVIFTESSVFLGNSMMDLRFWATDVKRFAICYRTVVCSVLSCSVCLSVCNVRALRPNGWTDQDET